MCKKKRSSQRRQHIQFWVQNRQFCLNVIAVWIQINCVCRSQNISCVSAAQQKICYKQTAVWICLLLLSVCWFLFWWDVCWKSMLFHHKCFWSQFWFWFLCWFCLNVKISWFSLLLSPLLSLLLLLSSLLLFSFLSLSLFIVIFILSHLSSLLLCALQHVVCFMWFSFSDFSLHKFFLFSVSCFFSWFQIFLIWKEIFNLIWLNQHQIHKLILFICLNWIFLFFFIIIQLS